MSWLTDFFGKKQPTARDLAAQVVTFEGRRATLEAGYAKAKDALDAAEKKALMGSGNPKQTKELREQAFEAMSMLEACRGVISDLRAEILPKLETEKQARLLAISTDLDEMGKDVETYRKDFLTSLAACVVAQIRFDGGEDVSRSKCLPRHRNGYLNKDERAFFMAELDRLKIETSITGDHVSVCDKYQRLGSEQGVLQRWNPGSEDVDRLIDEARASQVSSEH